MSKKHKEIDMLDNEFERLNDIYISMVHEGLLDDLGRCRIRNTIAENFLEAATRAADVGGYEDDGKLDIFGAYPDEVYAYVESTRDKQRLIDLFRSLLRR